MSKTPSTKINTLENEVVAIMKGSPRVTEVTQHMGGVTAYLGGRRWVKVQVYMHQPPQSTDPWTLTPLLEINSFSGGDLSLVSNLSADVACGGSLLGTLVDRLSQAEAYTGVRTWSR